MGQALGITVFSMSVVFVVLIGISFLIDLLRIVVEKGESKKVNTSKEETEIEVANSESIEVDTRKEEMTDEELVAVISAAVAASMGLELPDINIRSIKRVDNSWKNVARNEQVLKNI